MNVNVTSMGVHVTSAIEAWFETFQPKDTMNDRGIRMTAPGQSNHFAAPEHGSQRLTSTYFFRDAVQTQRCLV